MTMTSRSAQQVAVLLQTYSRLEHELPSTTSCLQELRGQKNDLEGFVASLRARESKLEEDLSAAVAARQAADAASATATAELRGLQV
jgi:peptidoglycan hydrolase CwlO-like protein